VSTLNDLIDKSGKCYTWEIFKQKYDFNDNVEFFRHKSVINATPKTWKNNMSQKGEKLTDTIDKDIQQLKSIKKTGKYFYVKKIKEVAAVPTNVEQKWETIIGKEINRETWTCCYSTTYTATKETKLRMLQMKNIHRILPTNTWLFKCNLKNTKSCTFCEINNETI
jgi:hypothetical protein